MKWNSKHKQAGFTLIEMMIVVVIIGVIAKLAYPSYMDSMRRGKRAEARSALMENAQFMERYFTENNAYQSSGSAPAAPTLPRTIIPPNASGSRINYNISVTVTASGSAYTLQAVPANSMTNDHCKTLTVNQLGQRSASGTLTGNMTADTCWTN